ncbi:neuraminidase-like domain-containing protein [Erwinia sp. HDF1-3R]|uniref:Tc toxin subunit A-related protein n=1 Tax=Erwinia sp. HDF1-3R TaxID=3141543 RepID=UPI0031F58E3F
MYSTDNILKKLNAIGDASEDDESEIESKRIQSAPWTLADMMGRSLPEIRNLSGNTLTWGEMEFLHQQADQELKENKLEEARILTRANPQLANAIRLGIRQSAQQRSYNDLFGNRASQFVKPGAVASMFSPAGYLTELYREARGLHPANSDFNLAKRRGDLASLSLSQDNMDGEISTLSLSNAIILDKIGSWLDKDEDGVFERLSTYRAGSAAPFHRPYEAARQALILQDEDFSAFRRNPEVAKRIDPASLLGIKSDISPELYSLLTEEITESNAEELIKKNFGDTGIEKFKNLSQLAVFYDLKPDELDDFLSVLQQRPYINHITTGFIIIDNAIMPYTLSREPGDGYYNNLNHFNLKRTDKNIFYVDLNTKARFVKVSLRITSPRSDYLAGYDEIRPRIDYRSSTFTLNDNDLKGTFKLNAYSYPTSTYAIGCYADFTLSENTGFAPLLLELNKLIRLSKATGFTPTEIYSVSEKSGVYQGVTPQTLGKLFWAQDTMQRYAITLSEALVLSGGTVSQEDSGNRPSAFTTLFNTPPLNGQLFSADGSEVNLSPANSSDAFRTGVMKRAFQVNDSGLYQLWSLASGSAVPPTFTCTIENVSLLYRIALLAGVNGLSVSGLATLIAVSPWSGRKPGELAASEFTELLSFVDRYAGWMNTQDLTPGELFLMTTPQVSDSMTPEIASLIETLNNGLASQGDNDDRLLSDIAPLIAAATRLESGELALAILMWLEQLKPQGMTVKAFLTLAARDDLDVKETKKLVIYCQVLGQLVLIVQKLALTAGELSLAVAQPQAFQSGATLLPQNITTLFGLARFHRFLQQCGTAASGILQALGEQTLTPAQLALALDLDEQMVVQGLAQSSDTTTFSSWSAVDATLQWVDIATTLGITPAGIAVLITLDYTHTDNTPSYREWVAISASLQAGLDSRQAARLQAYLDERTSAAVSTFIIENITPAWVSDREALYSWLLIDNKVSAEVKTTRLAEAIASIQLYINRTLSGQEQGENSAVKARAFFTDWDRYNKRYSSWAGVSQLVYYPENYLDPTLRIGQTGMMNEMLQSLSQSQLTSDTVEDAFKTYMTRFEEIANLEIVSGYHDDVSEKQGTTYLLGRSASGEYYWRTADIGKISAGKLPANAWSEWQKITAPVAAVTNLVRPVIFQSRLYLVWTESRQVAEKIGESSTREATEYLLKYAHILHNGSWSVPLSFTRQSGTFPPAGSDIADMGMYCARNISIEQIEVLFYKKSQYYSTSYTGVSGVQIRADGGMDEINSTQATKQFSYIAKQADSLTELKLNTPYGGGSTTYSASSPIRVKEVWGVEDLTNLYLSAVSNISISDASDEAILRCTPVANIQCYGKLGTRANEIMDLIRKCGVINDKFNIYRRKDVYASISEVEFIQRIERFTHFFVKTPYTNILMRGITMPSSSFDFILSRFKDDIYFFIKDINDLNIEYYLAGRENLYFYSTFFANELYIDTAVNLRHVKLSVALGSHSTLDLGIASSCSKYTLAESTFSFGDKEIALPPEAFTNNKLSLEFTFQASAPDGRFLGSETLRTIVTRVVSSNLPLISLKHSADNAQYLQYGPYRIRVNTLFAQQLVARANQGLRSVLSMDSQFLPEPAMGQGGYIQVVLPRYDAAVHGGSRGARITFYRGRDQDYFDFWQGSLTDTEQTVTLFVPLSRVEKPFYDIINFPYSTTSGLEVYLTCYKGRLKAGTLLVNYSVKGGISLSQFSPASKPAFTLVILQDYTEPMDFNGANALYFWEMFYYVPMMVFRRLLQEQKFDEATRWIKYIWSPEGYLVNGQPASWQWNVRPLEEDTAWNANPLDTLDPDAVAQADPMHYKVATFMAMLDLLIARGDTAYRLLERDTLNEAKMWYLQALTTLGEEAWLPEANWSAPRLDAAADKTRLVRTRQAMQAVRQQTVRETPEQEPALDKGEPRTANSLTALFLPQQNEKLQAYRQTLTQRLYNLRHHLSIDGQPLSLPIYAPPADPAALLSAAVNASQGGSSLPVAEMPVYRFSVMLESARSMVSQLSQFGSTLLSISERQDAEALSGLLQTQGVELVRQSIALQDASIAEIAADRQALQQSLNGAQSRLSSYSCLYDEGINTGEGQAMDLYLSASVLSNTAYASYMTGAALDAVPNIYGMAVGGAHYGSIARAVGYGIEIAAGSTRTAADRISLSESYRRRHQEWAIQRNAAESDVNQITAQLETYAIRHEAAVLQKNYLQTQQLQTQAQITFLQNKFSNKALYNWLHGKLAAIYYQFYDLAVSRCLMAQEAYKYERNERAANFIKPGAWQGSWGGMMAGETLQLNLARMEHSYLKHDQRRREVTRTVCLSEFYASLKGSAFALAEKVTELVTAAKGNAGTDENGIKVTSQQLQATIKLSDLAIEKDYPDSLGSLRRINQISVTLPALIGPYQDVRAVLNYSGSLAMPQGCKTLAVSHGMNDSGQFQLDFNDGRWLPFEGIPVSDAGTLTLSFPDANSRQKALLLSLSDIILHIRYTITGQHL